MTTLSNQMQNLAKKSGDRIPAATSIMNIIDFIQPLEPHQQEPQQVPRQPLEPQPFLSGCDG